MECYYSNSVVITVAGAESTRCSVTLVPARCYYSNTEHPKVPLGDGRRWHCCVSATPNPGLSAQKGHAGGRSLYPSNSTIVMFLGVILLPSIAGAFWSGSVALAAVLCREGLKALPPSSSRSFCPAFYSMWLLWSDNVLYLYVIFHREGSQHKLQIIAVLQGQAGNLAC